MAISNLSKTDKNVIEYRINHTQKKPDNTVTGVVKSHQKQRQSVNDGHDFKNHNYAKDMLVLHTQSQLQGAAVGPLLVISTAITSYYLQHSMQMVTWAILTSLCYTVLTLCAEKAAQIHPSDLNPRIWIRRYNMGYFLIGMAWVGFVVLQSQYLAVDGNYVFYAAILLIMTATIATSTFALKGAVYYVLSPVMGAIIIHAGITQSMSDIGHMVFQLTAAAFFIFLGGKLYKSNLSVLEYQIEKDALIAELEVANAISDEARHRAEEANLAKSRFLASMSHELRTPLNAILGFSEIMKNGVMGKVKNPTYLQYIGDIHDSGQHLLNLINEILDLSRIEAGKYELFEEAIFLEDIMSNCIDMITLKARNKQITLTRMFEDNLPTVWVDKKAIRQVILNLLSNAVKFTPAHGEIKIKLGWTAGGGQYLSVNDNGIGIPEDEIPIILSLFGQGSVAIKSAEQGTGLGLPIVQAIMKKHDGNFILTSKLHMGTTVTCIFPVKRILNSNLLDVPSLEYKDPQ